MPNTTLYLAPAGAGKTNYILEQARLAAASLNHEVRICVPTHLQAQAIRSRLAQTGGAIGIHVLTFDRLVSACLDATHTAVTELSEPVQYRLLQSIVTTLPLIYYQPLTDKPGFITVLQQLIAEWKSACIEPAALHSAFVALGNEPRLVELADIYLAYQTELLAHDWVDNEGRNWVAFAQLEQQPTAAANWLYLFIDGFDDFTPIQLTLLQQLGQQVGHMILTLTGGETITRLYPRLAQTRHNVEKALGILAQPLPAPAPTGSLWQRLSHQLFQPPASPIDSVGALTLLEAPDLPGELRQSLRWLKARLVQDGYHPAQVALLARDITPYRPFIRLIAQEMGLPLRLAHGFSLAQSPVIAALLDLLRLVLPDARQQPSLSRPGVISAWRSPYFNWRTCRVTPDGPPLDIHESDPERLDAAARYGRVMGGLDQWQEAFALLTGSGAGVEGAEDDDRQAQIPAHVPTGPWASRLQERFHRFVQRLTPPASGTFRDYVRWLETLIGPDPALEGAHPRYTPTSLAILTQVRANPLTADEDLAALQSFKEILRGLVWAEEALAGSASPVSISYSRFLSELLSAIQPHTYRPPLLPDQPAILVANLLDARGLSFRAVAVMGFGEGSFPQPVREDPFLRDADRAILRQQFQFALDPSTLTAEREFFYETLTRSREQLLLTRPRLADTGAEWVASPFWQTISQLTGQSPQREEETLDAAASWPEWLNRLAQQPAPPQSEALAWLQTHRPDLATGWHIATQLLTARLNAAASAWDGDLTSLSTTFAQTYGRDHTWSLSRLEQVQTCGHFFFTSHLLKLEPRQEPALGLDVRQLGSLYHALLEQVYKDPSRLPTGPSALATFVTGLAQPILAEAPRRYGFREAAWWSHSQNRIIADVVASVVALSAASPDFTPVALEARFGLPDNPLVIPAPDGSEDQLLLRGVVDRVDRNQAGEIRVIDYKLGGPASFTSKELERGRKLQLPLYALAMQEALGHGPAVDGFYWHVTHSQPSKLTLATYEGGIASALVIAIGHAWSAVQQVRTGHFQPTPPTDGCPDYCPAQAYCWHYRPKSW